MANESIFIKSGMKKVIPKMLRDARRSLIQRLLARIFHCLTGDTCLKLPIERVCRKWVECLRFESIENYALAQPQKVEYLS